jgi:hypothetical protein
MTIVGTAISSARAGLANLITRWRRMVDDVGTAAWTDEEAQEILDSYRTEHVGRLLTVQPMLESGATVWKRYDLGLHDLEESTSGTAAWRLYDSNGATKSPDNVDYHRGLVTFNTDQKGTAIYADCRSFDLYGAAAHGWREWMSTKASLYNFSADGAQYSRSQWFDHCLTMAQHYESQRPAGMTILARSDT